MPRSRPFQKQEWPLPSISSCPSTMYDSSVALWPWGPALGILCNSQLAAQGPPDTPRIGRTPVHRHPSRRKASRQLREEGVCDINVVHGTSHTRIDHGGLNRLAGTRVANADLRPALGIGVWVATVGHLQDLPCQLLLAPGITASNGNESERY